MLPSLQPIADHNEEAPKQLSARPADRTPCLRTHGPGDFNEAFERHGDETEARGAEDGEDDVWGDDRAGTGRPDEGEVG